MGIDLKDKGHKRKPGRKICKSPNPYLRLLVKLYQFLARRTNANINKVIAKRLIMSKRFKAPLSISRITSMMEKHEGDTAVVVAPVTDDIRLLNVPKLKVCALKFSETARKRIEAAGGKCMTFDEFALENPLGKFSRLLRGPTKSREAEKHFGKAPGVPGSHTKPYSRSGDRR